MFIGLGTVINIVAILFGSILGIIAGSRFREDVRNLITTALGFVTLLAAADSISKLWDEELVVALPKGWTLLTILISLLLGALIGSALRIESRLEVVGVKLKRKFDPHGSTPFVDGFVSASLLFVIGPMAILGSVSDGMGTGIDLFNIEECPRWCNFNRICSFNGLGSCGIGPSGRNLSICLDRCWPYSRRSSSALPNSGDDGDRRNSSSGDRPSHVAD